MAAEYFANPQPSRSFSKCSPAWQKSDFIFQVTLTDQDPQGSSSLSLDIGRTILMSHWKRHWCWKRLRAEGRGGIRGWDGWTVSWMQWRWTWANSGRWWGTGRPGMRQFMGLQRVGHNWAIEQQQQKENSNYNSTAAVLLRNKNWQSNGNCQCWYWC